ncbi:phage tail tape measure protein [Salmonella enterica subsp. enterica serovar Napoli]|nr:phage tail tape measure protein [Salmonella enterica subsp. enterica serovar Napoli]ECY6274020.1 phage tail tape measure protein [Salmonella enterica subsp. enterica serovar Napoli]
MVDVHGTPLRESLGYTGGGIGFGGQMADWMPPAESVDAALLPSLRLGNARADDLVRNNGIAANAVALHKDHIVGHLFLISYRPNWRYLGMRESAAKSFVDEVEAAWTEYCDGIFGEMDAEGKRTFTEFIREGVGVHAFNGEIFLQPVWDAETTQVFRTRFKAVSPKRVDTPGYARGNRQLRAGVETDRNGKALAYHVCDDDWPVAGGERWTRIPRFLPSGRPAMLHIFEPVEDGQTRGANQFYSVMERLKMLDTLQAERNYQETQKRRNEQNAALNRDNETESLRHQREVARITAMQYADAAVRNAALERENERHKKTLSQQAKKPKTYHNDEAGRLLLQYSQQQAQTEGLIAAAKLSTTEKMTEAHKQLLSFQQRIADLSGKKLTADEQSVLVHKDEIALALQKLDISQQDLQHQNALNELKKKTLTLTSQLADEESRVRQQHALALSTMGMGDQQRGRYEERLKIQQHYQEQLEQLKRDSKAKGTYGSDEYRQAEQALKGSLDRRLAEWADYNAKVDAAQGDWTQGASRALDNFLAQGGNVAGMTENVFTSAFNGMADSIANFAVTGKGSFRSLTVSILADLAKMEARIAASKLLGSVLAMFGFGTSAGGSTPSGAYSSAALSVIPNADGGVYRSAGLSQYSGSIVNRPTFFAFAKGAGVMGEAGPEAILPLRRGADGKLGVVAAGSGGMAMFAPEYNIEIHNDAGNGQIGPQALQAVYNIGKKAAIDFWQQQSRDGGIAGGGR